MITDDSLRFEVKQLKLYKDISYSRISDELGIKSKSFYSWLKNYYNLSPSNKRKLEKIIDKYKEVI